MPDRTPGSPSSPGSPGSRNAPDAPGEPIAEPARTDLAARVEALETQVQHLTSLLGDKAAPGSQQPAAPSSPEQPATPPPPSGRDAFWALTALQDRLPPPGGVVFAGSVTTDAGHVEFQWGRPTGHILEADWAERAETVGALGHPLRLALLRQLVDGERTVAHLVDELELGSTGVAYHHLNALQSGGWVTSPRRGTWAVPPTRVIPLLTILIALENG